eukprot:m.141648 g.141648  ORF g.141648 m.141648 type:complete len:72 (+) comp14041_c0_seq9:1179-1394(+)
MWATIQRTLLSHNYILQTSARVWFMCLCNATYSPQAFAAAIGVGLVVLVIPNPCALEKCVDHAMVFQLPQR